MSLQNSARLGDIDSDINKEKYDNALKLLGIQDISNDQMLGTSC